MVFRSAESPHTGALGEVSRLSASASHKRRIGRRAERACTCAAGALDARLSRRAGTPFVASPGAARKSHNTARTHRCQCEAVHRERPPISRSGPSRIVAGWPDLNRRPPAPQAGALPGYATPRWRRSARVTPPFLIVRVCRGIATVSRAPTLNREEQCVRLRSALQGDLLRPPRTQEI